MEQVIIVNGKHWWLQNLTNEYAIYTDGEKEIEVPLDMAEDFIELYWHIWNFQEVIYGHLIAYLGRENPVR